MATGEELERRYERIYGRKIQHALRGMVSQVADAMEEAGRYSETQLDVATTSEIRNVLEELHQVVGWKFGSAVYADLMRQAQEMEPQKSLRMKNDEISREELRSLIREWFNRYIATQVVDPIGNTTREEIRRAIITGLDEGLTVQEVAKSIKKDLYRLKYRYRHVAIARTEVLRSRNASTMFGADATKRDYIKKWIPVPDSGPNARDGHRGIEPVGKDQPFITGDGNKMMHPHDPSGPASETVNCRCRVITKLVPITIQEADEFEITDEAAQAFVGTTIQ